MVHLFEIIAKTQPASFTLPEWASDIIVKPVVAIIIALVSWFLGSRSAKTESQKSSVKDAINQLEDSWESLSSECLIHSSGSYDGTAKEHLSKIGMMQQNTYSKFNRMLFYLVNQDSIKSIYFEQITILTSDLSTNKSTREDGYAKSQILAARQTFNTTLQDLQHNITQGKIKII